MVCDLVGCLVCRGLGYVLYVLVEFLLDFIVCLVECFLVYFGVGVGGYGYVIELYVDFGGGLVGDGSVYWGC